MAVEPWDVQPQPGETRPTLHVVPSAPERRGLPIGTAGLVLSLTGLLGLPVVRAGEAAPLSTPRFSPGGLSAAQIPSLDSLTPCPGRRDRAASGP
jgi:hypothetical protein